MQGKGREKLDHGNFVKTVKYWRQKDCQKNHDVSLKDFIPGRVVKTYDCIYVSVYAMQNRSMQT